MKKLFTFLIAFLTIMGANAADITAVQTGNWSDPTTWGGSVPTATDNVFTNNFFIFEQYMYSKTLKNQRLPCD